MTHWSDEPPGGGAAGPPAEQYPPPAGQYGPPAAQYGPPVGQYGPPAGAYGPPGSPFGRKPPRETGALVVCIVLLVVALIGSFIASAAVYGNLTNDSSSSPPPVEGSYAPGGVAAEGGSSNGSASGGDSSTTSPGTDRATIVRDFPVYPGARKVASAKPYLKPGGVFNKAAKNYVTNANVGTVYHWYRAHLRSDHLKFNAPIVDRAPGSHKITTVFASVENSDVTVLGQFDIEPGVHGTSVLVVYLYG